MKTRMDINDIWDAIEAQHVWSTVSKQLDDERAAEKKKAERRRQRLAELGGYG